MSGCAKAVRGFIRRIDNVMTDRLNKGALNGAGKRLWPPRLQKKDAKSEFRFDQGHVYDTSGKVYDIILQPNRESKSPSIQNFIKKRTTHAILAKITVDRTKGNMSTEYFKRELSEDFERRERDGDFS